MKALFFSLCLLNLVFVLWQYQQGRFDKLWSKKTPLLSVVELATPVPEKQILLVSEVANAPTPPIQALPQIHLPQPATVKSHEEIKNQPVKMIELATETASADAGKSQCYEIGPFNDEAALQQWQKQQRISPDQLKPFYKGATEPSSFLVYYRGNGNTAEQIRAAKQFLAEKGVTDVWVIPTGELQGAVSLGVFKMQSRAERVQTEMAQKGISATILPRQSAKPALYVQFSTADERISKPQPLWKNCPSAAGG